MRGKAAVVAALLIAVQMVTTSWAADGTCTGSSPTVTWDGGAGTNRWEDGANWAPDGEPFTNGGIPDDFICIPATVNGQPVSVVLGAGVESHPIGIDAEGELTVGEGGKLFLHGPEESYFTTFNLVAGTLGGEGTVTTLEEFNWTALPDAAATQTTRELQDIPPENPDARPTTTPGHTVIAAGAHLNISGGFGHPYDPTAQDGTFGCGPYLCGGVNLRDRRIIVNRGTASLTNAGFIAADWGTRFDNHGEFVIENDRGYYQGFLIEGEPRSVFNNYGVLRKSSASTEDGPSETSVIDANYRRREAADGTGGVVAITAGTLSILSSAGEKQVADLGPGTATATGGCESGQQTCTAPEPTTGDPQISSLAVPQGSGGEVEIVERRYERRRVGERFQRVGEQLRAQMEQIAAAADDPLVVTVTVTKKEISDPTKARVVLNGSRLQSCAKAGVLEQRGACVAARSRTARGDVETTIHTTFPLIKVEIRKKLRFH